MATFSKYGARIGRPSKPIHLTQKHIDRCAEMLYTFDHFCDAQRDRISRSLCGISDETFSWDSEDLRIERRIQRLGPALKYLRQRRAVKESQSWSSRYQFKEDVNVQTRGMAR